MNTHESFYNVCLDLIRSRQAREDIGRTGLQTDAVYLRVSSRYTLGVYFPPLAFNRKPEATKTWASLTTATQLGYQGRETTFQASGCYGNSFSPMGLTSFLFCIRSSSFLFCIRSNLGIHFIYSFKKREAGQFRDITENTHSFLVFSKEEVCTSLFSKGLGRATKIFFRQIKPIKKFKRWWRLDE